MTRLIMTRRTLLGAAAAAALLPRAALAQLQIEISGVGANRLPIALIPMSGSGAVGIDPMTVVSQDLERTGAFRLIAASGESKLEEVDRPDLASWVAREANTVATGAIARLSDGRWEIRYRLFDAVSATELDAARFECADAGLRLTAHRIADRIYEKLTGYGAMFASRLAYVLQSGPRSYQLVVTDSDGANVRTVLRSHEPIISPAWSQDGTKLAYVSFETGKPVVYVHEVVTGRRTIAANFRGNNSAPAFSPDGKTLAVALSRDGHTAIYLMDLDGQNVRPFSRSHAIDTEPVFSPDGEWIYFTSDRGGSPQIYRQKVAGGSAERVTFNADYAVSPSVSPDGKTVTYIARTAGRYRVATLEVETGDERIISNTSMDESPCFSPNGRMVVFATERNRRGILAVASVDGSVHSLLSGPAGDIREPSWGPLLR